MAFTCNFSSPIQLPARRSCADRSSGDASRLPPPTITSRILRQTTRHPDSLCSTTGSRDRYDQLCLFGRLFDSGRCLSSDALGLARKSWRAEHRDFISSSVETARYPRTTVSTLSIATLADCVPAVPLPHGEILHAIAPPLVELSGNCSINHRRALFGIPEHGSEHWPCSSSAHGPPAGCP